MPYVYLFKNYLGDLLGSVERGVLGSIEKFAVNGSFLSAVDTSLVVHSAHLSHNEEVAVVQIGSFIKLLVGIFHYVVIVASAQSLVACNDDIALFTLILGDILTSVEVELSGVGSVLQHAFDS